MAYTIKEVKKIYENKINELNKNLENYGNLDRNQVVENNLNTFDFVNEQVDILNDENIKIEYEFINDNLEVTVCINDKKYSYNFNCNNCNINKGDKLLPQTGNVYLNMFIKNQLINEINNIKLDEQTRLNYANPNKALFTNEYNYVGQPVINIKNDNKIITISKQLEKVEINENEIPEWVKQELNNNKVRKIFRRR